MAMSLRPAMAGASLFSSIASKTPLATLAGPTIPLRLSSALPTIVKLAVPASFQLKLPTSLQGLWESILKAVPKKKTSHRKKRQRFLAGKGLKDATNLNRCSACGNIKKAHLLCPYCVQEIRDMWAKRAKELKDTITTTAKSEG